MRRWTWRLRWCFRSSKQNILNIVRYFSARRRLWLSPKHKLLSASQIRLSDVAKEPYLLLTTDDNTDTTLRYWKKHGLQPNVHFRTVSLEAVRSLVAANIGVTILSDIVYRPWSLDGEGIEARPIADKLPEIKIGIAWKRKRELPADSAKLFRDFCLERIYMTAGTAGRQTGSFE